ncbi:MAG: ABC transporter permease [Bacteroidota bacterium]
MSALRKTVLTVVPSALAIGLSFLVGGVFIIFLGKDPIEIFGKFFAESFGNSYGVGQILFKATPMIFTGLAAAICFRSGLFNIGAEGQLLIGAFTTAWVGFTFTSLPAFILLPLCVIGGILGGAFWGIIPGILKAKFGAHEVINTIMMNFIGAAMISYLVGNLLAVPGTVHTPFIAQSAELPRLGSMLDFFRGSPVNFSLFIAIGACIFMYYLLWKTRFGYELRTMGSNVNAARYGGINVARRTIMAFGISGGFAGLVGSNFVLGYKHYFELGFSENTGFIGIAVALLANNHPIGIIFSSLLFGILDYGGLAVNTIVPKEIVNILQALIIIFVIILTKVFDRWIVLFWKHEKAGNANV